MLGLRLACKGVWDTFCVSKTMTCDLCFVAAAFRLLALAVPDPEKTGIQIAYHERNIVECTMVVIVFSVNAGKVINT